jgi:hypothetical protein
MTDTLDNFRKRINVFIADAAAQLDAERYAHEQQLASALESLSQDSACQAAYADGRSEERSRCLALIDDHLSTLKRTGVQTMALESVRSAVKGD